jgi:peptide/nickel transport system substrate-binding protein
MAIDRQRIANNILNGMGVEVTGPEFIGSKDYDKSIEPWPFDPQAARRLLEEEGWFDSDGDGVLDKMIDGKKVYFRFSITYFVKNPTSEAVASYIATALKDIGIDVSLNGVDIADLTNSLEDKTFDALFLSWTQGTPPDDPRQIWHSSGAKEKGSSNMIGFANKEVDAIIDQLDYEYDEKKRVELFHRFHAILHDEQPYTFLYTPKISYLYREYLQNVFIPADRQDLIPGADVESPQASIFWLKTD